MTLIGDKSFKMDDEVCEMKYSSMSDVKPLLCYQRGDMTYCISSQSLIVPSCCDLITKVGLEKWKWDPWWYNPKAADN